MSRRMKKISFDFPPQYPHDYCWASEEAQPYQAKWDPPVYRSHCQNHGIYRMPDGKLYCASHVPIHPDAVRL